MPENYSLIIRVLAGQVLVPARKKEKKSKIEATMATFAYEMIEMVG